MNAAEQALLFDCEGADLIGILHKPERPSGIGLVTVAAGGIQYRAGCGRQLITLARALAEQGVAVLRFDHRGHGDSGGELKGFQHMGVDIARAVAVLREQVPEIHHVVLFGGCEAASAIMMDAWRLPGDCSMVVANPWVELEHLRASAQRRHYRQRLLDKQFWHKLFTGQYNLAHYARRSLDHLLPTRAKSVQTTPDSLTAHASAHSPTASAACEPFEERMLQGMQRFEGHALILASGASSMAGEFAALVASQKAWRSVCARNTVNQLALTEADQTFSTATSRAALCATITDWIRQMQRSRS